MRSLNSSYNISFIVMVRFSAGRNQSTLRNPPICHKYLTNYTTQSDIEQTLSPIPYCQNDTISESNADIKQIVYCTVMYTIYAPIN